MTYARRYPGGFKDYPDESTPVDAQYLNAVEDELVTLSGPGAAGDLTYVFTQLSPSATWNVAHNLGKNPSVSVVDSGGTELLVTVLYIDANNLTLSFGSPTSGKAYMN